IDKLELHGKGALFHFRQKEWIKRFGDVYLQFADVAGIGIDYQQTAQVFKDVPAVFLHAPECQVEQVPFLFHARETFRNQQLHETRLFVALIRIVGIALVAGVATPLVMTSTVFPSALSLEHALVTFETCSRRCLTVYGEQYVVIRKWP